MLPLLPEPLVTTHGLLLRPEPPAPDRRPPPPSSTWTGSLELGNLQFSGWEGSPR